MIMRELIISIAPGLVWFLAITEVLTAVVCVRNSRKILNILASAVSIGLAFDAVIIAVGMLVGEDRLKELIEERNARLSRRARRMGKIMEDEA